MSGFWKELMKSKFEIQWDKKSNSDDYVCKNCNYGWTSRKKFGSPAFCPRCRSNSIIKVDKG